MKTVLVRIQGEEPYYTQAETEYDIITVNTMNYEVPVAQEKMPEFPLGRLWWDTLTDEQQNDAVERQIGKYQGVEIKAPRQRKPRTKTSKGQIKDNARRSYKRIVAMLDLTDEEKLVWLGG